MNKQKNRYCKLCGNLIDNETKRCSSCGKQYFKLTISFKVLTIVFAVLLVISASIILHSTISFDNYKSNTTERINSLEYNLNSIEEKYNAEKEDASLLKEKNSKIEEEYQKLEQDYIKAKAQSIWCDIYVRIVQDDNTNLYHKYGCDKLDTNYKRAIYMPEAAEKMGYYPCPSCHD